MAAKGRIPAGDPIGYVPRPRGDGPVRRRVGRPHGAEAETLSMTHAEPRPATAADATGIAECVRAAYTHYIERIGRAPGPMLDDYDQVVRDHRAYVVEADADIIGVLVLMDKEDGIILDNVAILPSRQGEGLGRRLVEHAESEARRLGHRHLDL